MHANARTRLDVQLDALAHAERRRVLFALLRKRSRRDSRWDGPESGATVEVEALTDGTATRLDVYHNHLPKLDDLGFVSWDRESDVVAAGPQFEEIEPLLELLADHEDELPADSEDELPADWL